MLANYKYIKVNYLISSVMLNVAIFTLSLNAKFILKLLDIFSVKPINIIIIIAS